MMRIAIVGAGAIGAWLGVRLAEAGFEVSVLARGQMLTAIEQHGLRLVVDGKAHVARVQVSDRASALAVQELVILAVKGPSLPSMRRRLQRCWALTRRCFRR
jgi:2-dehydropantoate 2-reductase